MSVRRMLDPFSDIKSMKPPPQPWLQNHANAHTIEQGLRRTGRDPDNYVFFTTVRNPWARVFSAYKFGLRNPNSTWHAAAISEGCLDGFVMHPHVTDRLKSKALDQMTTARVRVFRLEQDSELLVELVCSLVGKEIELPHLNATDANDYTAAFQDQRAIDHVAEIFASDIAQGYEFKRPE